MDKRLGRHEEMEGSIENVLVILLSRGLLDIDLLELGYALVEAWSRTQIRLGIHLTTYLLLFLLGSTSHSIVQRLWRETLVVCLTNDINNEAHIVANKHTTLWQELRKRHFLLRESSKLRHDVDFLALVGWELILNLECAYRLNLIAEEIKTERQVIRERIHIENASANSKLPRLIYIILHTETEVAQLMLNVRDIDSLSYGKMYCTVIKDCLINRHFCKGRRIGNDEERRTWQLICLFWSGSSIIRRIFYSILSERRQSRENLCTENLVCSISLTVFYGTSITWREEKSWCIQLHQIMIEIACFVGISKNKNYRIF